MRLIKITEHNSDTEIQGDTIKHSDNLDELKRHAEQLAIAEGHSGFTWIKGPNNLERDVLQAADKALFIIV